MRLKIKGTSEDFAYEVIPSGEGLGQFGNPVGVATTFTKSNALGMGEDAVYDRLLKEYTDLLATEPTGFRDLVARKAKIKEAKKALEEHVESVAKEKKAGVVFMGGDYSRTALVGADTLKHVNWEMADGVKVYKKYGQKTPLWRGEAEIESTIAIGTQFPKADDFLIARDADGTLLHMPVFGTKVPIWKKYGLKFTGFPEDVKRIIKRDSIDVLEDTEIKALDDFIRNEQTKTISLKQKLVDAVEEGKSPSEIQAIKREIAESIEKADKANKIKRADHFERLERDAINSAKLADSKFEEALALSTRADELAKAGKKVEADELRGLARQADEDGRFLLRRANYQAKVKAQQQAQTAMYASYRAGIDLYDDLGVRLVNRGEVARANENAMNIADDVSVRASTEVRENNIQGERVTRVDDGRVRGDIEATVRTDEDVRPRSDEEVRVRGDEDVRPRSDEDVRPRSDTEIRTDAESRRETDQERRIDDDRARVRQDGDRRVGDSDSTVRDRERVRDDSERRVLDDTRPRPRRTEEREERERTRVDDRRRDDRRRDDRREDDRRRRERRDRDRGRDRSKDKKDKPKLKLPELDKDKPKDKKKKQAKIQKIGNDANRSLSKYLQGFGYRIYNLETDESKFTLDRPNWIPEKKGKGSAEESFTVNTFDNDPPSQKELDMGIVKTIMSKNLGFRSKKSPKKRKV